MQPLRITVTGAAGQIAYSLLFRIASGEMFGANQPVSLQLLECEPALGALNGVAMELTDCAFPLLTNIVCTADPNLAFDGANWALLVGAMPRGPGMKRKDLLQANAGIFKAQGAALNAVAASDIRVLVVGNPCNTNASIASRYAPDIAPDRFFAMTALDETRARAQLALKAGVTIDAVKHMAIWGNHSLTQFPDFYATRIDDQLVTEVLPLDWLQTTFLETVQKRGAEIIAARGKSSAASAANAVVKTVRDLTQETTAGECFSLVRRSTGEYDIPAGLFASFPCEVHGGVLQVCENWSLNTDAKDRIATSVAELQSEQESLVNL